ncbi:hypothetical protein ACUXCC_004483 [Cytobacillus horneckiae]|uniref:hypothetical protein n=1 Tax=Cytobacillus horneckiae TaxID=549687 RepID=UPI0019D10193|nr:hypothetical protein [Cytobacillus horneckiae]MBN6889216.1 hypothetical protein [Cytobacillus horneckiae]MCM3178434.1 hypothetical protein [Cytobacillus horneckiae]
MNNKYILILVMSVLFSGMTGCSNVAGKKVEDARSILPLFKSESDEMPPKVDGHIEINGQLHELAKGGYTWENGNTVVTTDAASPAQIAETLSPINVEPESEMSIEIEQSPSITIRLWEGDHSSFISEGNEVTAPTQPGEYIYEAIAKWSNGEVSFTFVIEV